MASGALRELRKHEVPNWWHKAGLGIFIHWTPASVPAYAPKEEGLLEILTSHDEDAMSRIPYTEWYENSLRFPNSPVAKYHYQNYGSRPYSDFGADFNEAISDWDPTPWAEVFRTTGAKYVVLVTKHHDGFGLWPSRVTNPYHKDWHTRRDVVGELAEAVRGVGLRFGVYYSGGLDWTFNATPIGTMVQTALAVPRGQYPAYADAQVRELIERYRPSVLWNDISWPGRRPELWSLFEHYYRSVPEGVINDRWLPYSRLNQLLRFKPIQRQLNSLFRKTAHKNQGLIPPKPPHFDVRTPEYTAMEHAPECAWETVRGMDASFGFNQTSTPEDFISKDELLHSLHNANRFGGNLLINVGPTASGEIPPDQLERLRWLGEATALRP